MSRLYGNPAWLANVERFTLPWNRFLFHALWCATPAQVALQWTHISTPRAVWLPDFIDAKRASLDMLA